MSELRLDGKVALVTGAGRGLGRAYALLLAERGASVVVNDLGGDLAGDGADAAPAREVVAAIVAAGGQAVANLDSVASEDAARGMVAQALDTFGGLHIVVNNAGNFTPASTLLDTPPDHLRRLWEVHLMGAFHIVRAAWPTLTAQRYGRIVNVGSHTGYFGLRNRYDYATVKGAMHGFTMTLAMEAAEHGIAANLLAPGGATRPVTSGHAAAYQVPAFAPELVAPTVLWLAHEECTANGQSFGAIAGSTSRIVIAETNGFQSRSPTAEAIRDHRDQIMDVGDVAASNLVFPAGAEQRGAELIRMFDQSPA